jgi:hypothetical protein
MLSKKDLIARGKESAERNPTRKISPELQKMHSIFGDPNADCGMAAQYEDGTCSRIAYDPAKMSFRKRMEIEHRQQPTEAPSNHEAETQAMRFLKFSHLINPTKKTRRK